MWSDDIALGIKFTLGIAVKPSAKCNAFIGSDFFINLILETEMHCDLLLSRISTILVKIIVWIINTFHGNC